MKGLLSRSFALLIVVAVALLMACDINLNAPKELRLTLIYCPADSGATVVYNTTEPDTVQCGGDGVLPDSVIVVTPQVVLGGEQ